MRLGAALAIVILLAGCTGTGHAPLLAAGTAASLPSESAATWGLGETIEFGGCRGHYIEVVADRARLEAVVPATARPPGVGPVPLILHVDRCERATLGVEALATDVSLLVASYGVAAPSWSNSTADPRFVVDASTSMPIMEVVLRGAGVAGSAAAVTVSGAAMGETVAVDGPAVHYTVQVAPPSSDPVRPSPYAALDVGGPDVGLGLQEERDISEADRFDTPCLATFTEGPLATIFPSPVPCTAHHQQSTSRFQFVHGDLP